MDPKDSAVENASVEERNTAPTDTTTVENNDSEVTDDTSSSSVETVDDNDSGEWSAADLKQETDGDAPAGDGKPADKEENTAEETEQSAQSQGDGQSATESQTPQEWGQLSGRAQDRFRQAINERNEWRERAIELEARSVQVATEQDLLDRINPDSGEPYTPDEAARIARYQTNEALQQRYAQERQALQVQQDVSTIVSHTEQALRDFPMLDPYNKEVYDESLAAEVDAEIRANLIADQQGNVVGYRQSPYEISKRLVGLTERIKKQAIEQSQAVAQANAQRSTERMLANADHVPGASQGETRYENMTLAQKAEYLRKRGHDV